MPRLIKLSASSLRRTAFILALLLTGCGSPEERAQNYYERGMKLLAQQDYVKAGIELKNAVQLKKDMVGAWRGLAEIELHNRNYQAAFPLLRTVVELDPKDMETRLKLGHFLLAGNALDQALDMGNAAIALDGRNANALALRSAVLLKLKDSFGAKRDAQAALEIDPKNVESLIVLAAERLARSDSPGALQILNRAELDDNIAIQLFKLQVFEQSKDVGQSEAMLQKLVQLYPKEPAFAQKLIKLYLDQKRFEEAEKGLRTLADLDPSNVEAGLNVVRFLQQVKGPAAARQELVTRIGAGEPVFKYQMALAEFDLSQGNLNEGTNLLEELVKKARSPEDVLTAQVKLAQIQLQQKKLDATDTLVSAILRKDGRNTDGLKLRAMVHMEKGELDPAISDLRQALDGQPRSSELMVLLASAYERSGSIELADKQYADATKVSNYDVLTSLNYVAFLRRRGSLERAEDVLTELIRRTPDNLAALTTLADVRLARQNWIGAQSVSDTIRRINSSNGLADQVLAAALTGRGRYDDSIQLLQGLQNAAPNAVQPMAALVDTLVRAKKVDQALSFLQTVLRTNPSNAEAHVLLGTVQLVKNAPEQAEKSFKTAVERQPADVAGYKALAEFYAGRKNLEEAEKVARQGLERQSDSVVLHSTLAGILEEKADFEGAIAEYELILKKDPGSMIVANNLASLLADHRADKANLDRAYSLASMLRKSQVPFFKDTLGWLDYLRGDYKSSTVLLEEAAAALPNRAIVQYHLGMSYIGSGQTAKGAERFKKAQELSPDSGLSLKIKTAQEKLAM